jgi:hypothetical protein
MMHLVSTRTLCVFLLLATACKKENIPTPQAPQAPLEGKWLDGEGSYKHFDSKGQLSESGYTLVPNPAVYSTLDGTTWKQSGQLTNEYTYTRQDSSLVRSFHFILNNKPDRLDDNYHIVQLTEHRLVLRKTSIYSDGSRAIDIETYSR